MTESTPTPYGNIAIDIFDSANTSWKRWLMRFEGAVAVFGIVEAKKVAYLLHFIGSKSFDILCDRLAPEDPYKKTYEELTAKLEEFYAPAPLEVAENFRFHQRKQMEGENVQQFVAALHKLSINCKFGEYLKTALRNQLVFGLSSKRIQSRLLEIKDLTFDKAVETAISMELSEKDTNQIHSGTVSVDYVSQNETRKKNHRQEQKQKPSIDARPHTFVKSKRHTNPGFKPNSYNVSCFRCGGKHFATKCTLNKEIVCGNCGIKGHVRKVCMRKNQAAAINVNDILWMETEHLEYREKYFVTLKVEGRPMRLEIDSGAAVTIVSKDFIKRWLPNVPIAKSNLKLTTYCKSIISVLGYVRVKVEYKNISKMLNMYVSDKNREPLLGREWIRQLRVQLDETVSSLNTNTTGALQEILQNYDSKLDQTSKKIRNVQARLTLKENARPCFLKARRVPFKLIPLVEREIEKLEKDGILDKVHTSKWATPIVPVLKKGDRIRLCGDFSVTLNKYLQVDEYPLPTIDELFSTLAGGEKFSKIDLKEAYLQMEIHPDDRELVTLNTHRGLFKCTRLLYGIASAPAIWQREIENILKGIPGVSVFLDDIKITGSNDKEHLQRLNEVLTRLANYNIQINKEKSVFFQKGISYCGYYIDKQGIHKEKCKMEAIERMPRPRNVTELRAFLGMINYYGRFIPNLSSILNPLHSLLEKKDGREVPFEWTTSTENAFIAAKKEFLSERVLVHYDPKLPLIVATDASAYGVGAVLSHRFSDGTERVIQYASQSLSRTQRNYAQIDKEAYAIIFAIKKFYQYLYGNRFTLVTDHRPLTQIFSQQKALPIHSAMRMQHYAIFLQAFTFDIEYKNTKLHGNADGLSRLPVKAGNEFEYDVVDNYEINLIDTLPITIQDLEKETMKDTELNKLRLSLLQGKKIPLRERFNIPQIEFNCQRGIILREGRVVIPRPLRNKILKELHAEHFGIVKMKAMARQYVWWPGMDRDLENTVRDCANCNLTQNEPPKIRGQEWKPSSFPFQRVHIDYAGPFLGHYFLILVDSFSKWPEVHITKNITSATTIHKCRQTFSTFGIPELIVSDNGRSFTSMEFAQFLKANGIKHKTTAPFHPATNGQAERFVQTLKLALKKKFQDVHVTKLELATAIQKFLFQYRCTPQQTTGVSPAERILNYKVRTRFDLLVPAKENKANGNNACGNVRSVQVGDRVKCRNYYGNKKWAFGTVKQKLGKLHYIIRVDDGRMWKRHIDQICTVGKIPTQYSDTIHGEFDHGPPIEPVRMMGRANQPQVEERETLEAGAQPQVEGSDERVDVPSQTPRRSTRKRKGPERFGEPIPF
ncbi:hypothetical protein KPH14_012794 [Odynerus spinipes]|uniref:RNA-directed DNA polymerase n=1 Tax=Odynerus spinipes TaxID=1348599 RepID=A0AAD9REN4_9HYME|nr:hypothetical protein KPH14_012794 [Odynerus spinipes]